MTDQKRPAARATRRRGQELVDAIHRAVIAEAAENGVSGLSMEGIARRAETAKTSLYRRWGSPEDILVEAVLRHFPQETPTPEADNLRGDLVRSLELFRGLMSEATLGRALMAVFAEGLHRPELLQRMVTEVYEPRGGRFTRTVLEHYAARGEVDPARITDVTTDIGEAMMIKYCADHPGEVPSSDYLARIVDEVILPAVGWAPEG
ncbi:TetR/AcrR family transcriptional regulator [Nocardiopsis sp. L17-MgMaSL7]|uniref:TetR/AcrR family transcriptional regulator n=1 Tax=Nocardiopsis sp. L17-MgMaSL7 TaxID=1938893 RepID=UPI000D71AA38|nr:TetR/AcrR family transcriptional regulator [Nocardiopsis sp. L17-MgMaSL7]PWV47833.1 TetR family transcriptional regulator [Nocardiopsis sp. L17-MgMaSL7]